MRYEYKVVPAPAKPRKAPKIKGAEAKFAHGLEATMNDYAADGWEYLRADILPSEERRGLRSSQTVYRTVLVFRRPLGQVQEHAQPVAVPERQAAAPAPEPQVAEPTSDTEPSYDEAREAERRARFSLVGPARRAEDSAAPPLSAPHVRDDASNEGGEPEDRP